MSSKKKSSHNLTYRRLLIKISGEALLGKQQAGIDPEILYRLAEEFIYLQSLGVQIGLVIGGGNFLRGVSLAELGIHRLTGDHMGMLATIINALAMQDILIQKGKQATVMSALDVPSVVQKQRVGRAIQLLENQEIVIFSAGVGNPLFTTDTSACLRGIEINADLIIKATKVDGVYDKDPEYHQDAKKYSFLSYKEVVEKELKVMDLTAICLLQDHPIPLRIVNIYESNTIQKLVFGEDKGTLVYTKAL